MTHATTHRHADDPPERKNVLYCPECGHESPIDGDWRVTHEADRVVYACPVCAAAVTARPERLLSV